MRHRNEFHRSLRTLKKRQIRHARNVGCLLRVISNFHDYYDCVQGQGQDQTLIYLRKSEVENWRFDYFPTITKHGWKHNINVDRIIIGFCGSIYPILKCKRRDEYAGVHTKRYPEVACTNLDEIEDYVIKHCNEYEQASYYGHKQTWKYRWLFPEKKHIAQFFEECKQKRGAYADLFSFERPLFVAENEYEVQQGWVHKIKWNGRLKQTGFITLFDPYRAYQEISMFLGGMARPEKNIPHIDDKTMAEIKGFDKWSFRKEPTKRK